VLLAFECQSIFYSYFPNGNGNEVAGNKEGNDQGRKGNSNGHKDDG
jgi:hypothetical protein